MIVFSYVHLYNPNFYIAGIPGLTYWTYLVQLCSLIIVVIVFR